MKKIFTLIIILTLSICMLTMPMHTALASADVEISAKAGYLMDYASGEVMFSKCETEHLPIASMVKMMTLLIALEEYSSGAVTLDTPIFSSENASGMGGSQVFLDANIEYRFEDLLKAVIIASANDASVALAEYFNGNERSFVNRMNKRAKELGMANTNYVNSTGLPAPEQYSCAKDCATLMCEVLKHDLYHNYSTIWMDNFTHPSGRITEIVNTNKLIRYYNGCDSGKTGSTNEAGCCLTASAKRGDMRLISVIIGAENSKTRFNESSALLSYGFGNFENKFLVKASDVIGTIKVEKGKADVCEVFAKEDFSTVVKKGDTATYEVFVDIQEKAYAPLLVGDKVGTVTITKNGNIVKTIDVVVGTNIDHISYLDSFAKIIKTW